LLVKLLYFTGFELITITKPLKDAATCQIFSGSLTIQLNFIKLSFVIIALALRFDIEFYLTKPFPHIFLLSHIY